MVIQELFHVNFLVQQRKLMSVLTREERQHKHHGKKYVYRHHAVCQRRQYSLEGKQIIILKGPKILFFNYSVDIARTPHRRPMEACVGSSGSRTAPRSSTNTSINLNASIMAVGKELNFTHLQITPFIYLFRL